MFVVYCYNLFVNPLSRTNLRGREERGVNGLVVDSEESHGFPLGVKYANRTYRTREAT